MVLGCNSKGLARHSLSRHRWAVCIIQSLHTAWVVCTAVSWQDCLLGWCWSGCATIHNCWWHKWDLLLLVPVMALPQEEWQCCTVLSQRHLALTLMPGIAGVWWGWGGGPWGSCMVLSVWPSRIAVTAASRIRTYAGRSHLISSLNH